MSRRLSAELEGAAGSDIIAPEHDENGVDLTLVRATLAMTPTERLKSLENAVKAIASARPLKSASNQPVE